MILLMNDVAKFPGAGLSQHPIIFGKSKDSILVPEFTCEQQQQQQQFNYHQQFNNLSAAAAAATSSSNQQQQYEQLTGDASPLDQEYHLSSITGDLVSFGSEYQVQATTHVLTDEKGHSIKIRIASPPPQRQSQLAKLHKQHQQQQRPGTTVVMATNSTTSSTRPGHRDSVISLGQTSDCPLMAASGPARRRSSSGAMMLEAPSENQPHQPQSLNHWAEYNESNTEAEDPFYSNQKGQPVSLIGAGGQYQNRKQNQQHSNKRRYSHQATLRRAQTITQQSAT